MIASPIWTEQLPDKQKTRKHTERILSSVHLLYLSFTTLSLNSLRNSSICLEHKSKKKKEKKKQTNKKNLLAKTKTKHQFHI